MSDFSTPGVYIQEISTLPASVAGVETAIPAFIGYTEKAGAGDQLLNKPTRISSILEYVEKFGGPQNEAINIKLTDTLDGGGAVVSRVVKTTLATPSGYKLYHSLQMYFNNGGGPCFIVAVGKYSDATFDSTHFIAGINSLEKVDEPTLIVFPDATSLTASGNPDVTKYGDVAKAALAHCNKLQDRFTVLDVIGDSTNITTYRGALGMSYLNYGAVYHPYLRTSLTWGVDESTLAVATHENPPAGGDLSGETLADLEANEPSTYRAIRQKINEMSVTLPPSGAMVGIYARVDKNRGVWKAPANVSVNSVIAPTIKVNNDQQGALNVDPSTGKSINVIRNFVGKGTIVWGARTLQGNSNEWRYIPVRRLYIYIEESLKKATEFVVFEPNDANTWLRVRGMSENFLTKLWRAGALQGASTAEAFFVKVGLGETMTPLDILEGRLNVEIGLAAVRPAEFIILKFSHKLAES